MKLDAQAIESIGDQVQDTFSRLTEMNYRISMEHGWYEEPRTFGDILALMHSELSEALEAYRNADLISEKIRSFSPIEEELADLLIRVFDYAGHRNLRLGRAIIAKMLYNNERPHRHGGKRL